MLVKIILLSALEIAGRDMNSGPYACVAGSNELVEQPLHILLTIAWLHPSQESVTTGICWKSDGFVISITYGRESILFWVSRYHISEDTSVK